MRHSVRFALTGRPGLPPPTKKHRHKGRCEEAGYSPQAKISRQCSYKRAWRAFWRICGPAHLQKQVTASNKQPHQRKSTDTKVGAFSLVGEAGFGPAKSVTTDLQSAPFGRSGIPPYYGAGDRIRTNNLLITNQLLCRWATPAGQRSLLYQKKIRLSISFLKNFYLFWKMFYR